MTWNAGMVNLFAAIVNRGARTVTYSAGVVTRGAVVVGVLEWSIHGKYGQLWR